MSAHRNRHAQSLKAMIDAIAEAPSLSVAINTHWNALIAAIDRSNADELKNAVSKMETLISAREETRPVVACRECHQTGSCTSSGKW